MTWEAVKAFFAALDTPFLHAAFRVILIMAVGGALIRVINRTVKRILENSKLEKAAHSLIRTLVKTVLYVLLGLILASSLGIDVTGIVAFASVASLAVSLALQNMLANVIGGFTLLYTHPFSSGDWVEIAGQGGTVREVGIAYTKLTTADNKLISIPNSAVVSAEIVNYTVTGTRRVDIKASASYDCDPEEVLAALMEAAQDERVLADPAPGAVLSEYGESAISYSVRVWVKTEDYWPVYHKINRSIREVFKAKGIRMTYPHMNVHIEK